MKEVFIGREKELAELNELYIQDKFQLFVLYGRRRVGKTTLLNEFCKNKPSVFFSAEQSNAKLNLDKFSKQIFDFYGENTLSPFSSWEKALTYIDERQKTERLILVIDEFPYLVSKNKALLSEFQHLIDHKLKYGNLFIILCGSYMGFMEKEVLGSKSPLFGRRTGQLYMKPFNYQTSLKFLEGFSDEDKLCLYGALGGIPLYLQQVNNTENLENNIKRIFLKTTAYLYEEPLLLLRQEVQDPGIYSAIIEAIASGYTKANEISTKIGEDTAKCIKYIQTLCKLGILYKDTPFGEKESTRKSIYGISDMMFRFWYRYVFANRTLVETGAQQAVWEKRIEPNYSTYMGLAFEKICTDYLTEKNAKAELPFLFTSIGRWWGTNPKKHTQEEIDIIAQDGDNYLICECKWRNEKTDITVLAALKEKADIFNQSRQNTWYVLFSKSGFSETLIQEATKNNRIILVDINKIINSHLQCE